MRVFAGEDARVAEQTRSQIRTRSHETVLGKRRAKMWSETTAPRGTRCGINKPQGCRREFAAKVFSRVLESASMRPDNSSLVPCAAP